MAAQGVRIMSLAALALLAGCGAAQDEQQGEGTVITGQDGDQVQIGGDAADQLPAGFTPYPGAQVVGATAVAAGDGGGGVIMVMQTADTPAQVIAFYRAQATAAGVTISAEAQTGPTTAFNGEGPNGLGVAVSAAGGPDGQTVVQLTAGSDR